MKTDELIEALARHAEPVPASSAASRLTFGSLLGIAAAVPLMLMLLGVNPELSKDARVPMFWVKALFVASIALASWVAVRRLAQPGASARRPAWAVATPFVLMAALAAAVLVAAPPDARTSLVLGSSWQSCPVNITLLSLPALVLLLATARSLAPTRPRLAGGAIGLLAGSLGTLVYLLHCPELQAPFVATWYVLGMAIPAVLGALVGRRALAW